VLARIRALEDRLLGAVDRCEGTEVVLRFGRLVGDVASEVVAECFGQFGSGDGRVLPDDA